jgi:hypothetical protein
MAVYRAERLEERSALDELPVLPGHRPIGEPPDRSEVWSEVFDGDDE